jgi:hypothetical protein
VEEQDVQAPAAGALVREVAVRVDVERRDLDAHGARVHGAIEPQDQRV